MEGKVGKIIEVAAKTVWAAYPGGAVCAWPPEALKQPAQLAFEALTPDVQHKARKAAALNWLQWSWPARLACALRLSGKLPVPSLDLSSAKLYLPRAAGPPAPPPKAPTLPFPPLPGAQCEALDANGLWWKVTAFSPNPDGTYRVTLDDCCSTKWDRVSCACIRQTGTPRKASTNTVFPDLIIISSPAHQRRTSGTYRRTTTSFQGMPVWESHSLRLHYYYGRWGVTLDDPTVADGVRALIVSSESDTIQKASPWYYCRTKGLGGWEMDPSITVRTPPPENSLRRGHPDRTKCSSDGCQRAVAITRPLAHDAVRGPSRGSTAPKYNSMTANQSPHGLVTASRAPYHST
eukprot:Sspe_Gene.3547::Locus_1177_Transcript_1_1_Confidence_1.000_Length_1127::g.3547::m.3547